MNLGIQIVTAGVCILLLLSGCKTSTTISSTPSGVNVYLNGDLVGQTPVTVSTRKTTVQHLHLSLSAQNLQTLDTALSRRQNFIPQRLLGAPLVLPLLYLHDFKAENHFVLQRIRLQVDYNAEENTPTYKRTTLSTQLKELEEQYNEKVIKRRYYKREKKRLEAALKALSDSQ